VDDELAHLFKVIETLARDAREENGHARERFVRDRVRFIARNYLEPGLDSVTRKRFRKHLEHLVFRVIEDASLITNAFSPTTVADTTRLGD
jgi:hypothetical protein